MTTASDQSSGVASTAAATIFLPLHILATILDDLVEPSLPVPFESHQAVCGFFDPQSILGDIVQAKPIPPAAPSPSLGNLEI